MIRCVISEWSLLGGAAGRCEASRDRMTVTDGGDTDLGNSGD